MSLFKKLFGKEKPGPPKVAVTSPTPVPPAPVDPSKDPNMIRVFDSYGRELFITRQQWRDNVLLGNLKDAWNEPDKLYQLIVSALNDGFHSDVIGASEQLYEIDPFRRSASVLFALPYIIPALWTVLRLTAHS